jgi:hypothetical protein
MAGVSVKHGSVSHELADLDVSAATLSNLHAVLEQLTGVLARHQKLIHKGKVRRRVAQRPLPLGGTAARLPVCTCVA